MKLLFTSWISTCHTCPQIAGISGFPVTSNQGVLIIDQVKPQPVLHVRFRAHSQQIPRMIYLWSFIISIARMATQTHKRCSTRCGLPSVANVEAATRSGVTSNLRFWNNSDALWCFRSEHSEDHACRPLWCARVNAFCQGSPAKNLVISFSKPWLDVDLGKGSLLPHAFPLHTAGDSV